MNFKIPHLPILTFLLLISSYVCFGADEPAPVLDSDGESVLAGVDYYVLPATGSGGGGGLTLDSTDDENPCPLDVVQSPLEADLGLPLYFKPVDPKEGVVRLLTDLNVIFNASSICVQTTLWTLDFDDSIGKFFITTGGVEGNPGRETVGNWFRIERYDSDYKIVYCPGVCDTCRVVCGEVGIFIKNGKRLLVVSESPLRVVFKKA